MTSTALALLGYIGWTLVLILINEGLRAHAVLARGKSPSTFLPDGSDVSPFSHRLARAHANCVESFPLIGGLLLLALATGQTDTTDALALWLLAARVAQSTTHLVSIHDHAVTVRFLLFAVQLGIVVAWTVSLALQWAGA